MIDTQVVAGPTTAAALSPRPRYLGLLNEIAEAEARGARYLRTWLGSADEDVARILRTVAARESEHASTFARRVDELGFVLRSRPDREDEVFRQEVAESELSDAEKLEALGYGRPPDPDAGDIFDRYFEDHTIDPATGALLGRFIAEERDSERLLHRAWLVASRRPDGPSTDHPTKGETC